jgi:nucleoid-associated protein EbfC
MFNKIKHLKDLRNQAKNMQTQLATEFAEGTAAWGKVKIVINGNQEVTSIAIDPELLTDKEKLQDALKEAFNDAVKKIQRVIAMKMQQMGGLAGLGL